MSTRRHLLKFSAGAAAGVVFTPAPWKLLDDVSIRTQNAPWTASLPRGDVQTKFSACTLCGAGCGVRARTVGGSPFSLAGVASHPVSRGRLCPLGVTAHHVAFHPKRIRHAFRRDAGSVKPARVEEIAAELAKRLPAARRVVFLDGRPGTTESLLYRRAAASFANAVYVPVPQAQGATLRTAAAFLNVPAEGLAFDFAKARTVLSFSTPVLDGWGGPGADLEGKRLIQVEPFLSRTAARAARWLPAKPGAEAHLALAIAGRITPAEAARVSGLPAEEIAQAAREFQDGPAIVVADAAFSPGERVAMTALAVAGGCIVRRSTAPLPPGFENLPAATELESLPDGSIDVLLAIEPAGVPAPLLRRKLASGATVVALSSCLGGITRRADYVIPVPAPFESTRDTAAPAAAPVAVFGISPALLPAAQGTVEPTAFAKMLVPNLPAAADLFKARAEAIQKAGRGKLFRFATGETVPVKDAGDLWAALGEGACWFDDATTPVRGTAPAPAAVPMPPDAGSILAVGDTPCGGFADALVSPLLTKVYQESRLRQSGECAAVHPETAQELGLAEGCDAVLEGPSGAARVRIELDNGVMPGVFRLSGGPAWAFTAGAADAMEATAMERLGGGRFAAVRVTRV